MFFVGLFFVKGVGCVGGGVNEYVCYFYIEFVVWQVLCVGCSVKECCLIDELDVVQ